MKKLFSISMTVILLLACTGTHAEVYSWIDKDGKKHFGEKVPKEYRNKSTELDIKPINTMDATRVSKTPTTNMQRQQQNPINSMNPDADTQHLSSCEQQKLAYKKSVECYSRCQMNNRTSSYVNNVAACSNCVDAKKPNCN